MTLFSLGKENTVNRHATSPIYRSNDGTGTLNRVLEEWFKLGTAMAGKVGVVRTDFLNHGSVFL